MSNASKTPLQASKWLKIAALLEESEMLALFETLGEFSLYRNGAICPSNATTCSKTSFLAHYKRYIEEIKRGEEIDIALFRLPFALMMSCSEEALFLIQLSETECLVRSCAPVIVMQAHQITYSSIEKKFRSMMFGTESIPWGIQFSYPQIWENPESKDIESVKQQAKNSPLFHSLQKWMRSYTIPTPFLVENERHNVPMRLGKHCLPWINQHAALIKQNISVS